MYIASLLAFSLAKPWRKDFWTNLPFMIVLVIVLSYSFLMTVAPETRLGLFQMSWMKSDVLNGYVLAVSMTFSFFIYWTQKFIL